MSTSARKPRVPVQRNNAKRQRAYVPATALAKAVEFDDVMMRIGILIEHYAGEFPLWLAPVQAIVLPIADRHIPYAVSVSDRLRAAGLRAETDDRSESISRKVREAELRKIPYLLVVGDREQEADGVSLRQHGTGDRGVATVEEVLEELGELVGTRSTAP